MPREGLLLDRRIVFSGHPTTGRRRSALRTRQKNCGLGNLGIEMLHTYILHAHTIHVHITILALRHFSLSFENSSLHAAFAMALPTGHGSLFFLSSSFTPPALFSFFSRDSLHVTFAVALPAAYGIFFGSGCLRLLGVRACGLHLHDGRLLCRGPGPSCTERWKSYSPLLVLAEDFGGLPTGTHMAVMAITAEGWAQAQVLCTIVPILWSTFWS